MFQWPSNCVPQGGIYHPPKVQYSPETAQFLKGLIQESRFSNELRDKVKYTLRSGEPLPPLKNAPKKSSRQPPVLIRIGSSKRRSQKAIVESGVYEREKFIPCAKKFDREKIKNQLQNIMAYGKDMEPKPPKPQKIELDLDNFNRFDEIKKQIKEREEWLEEMEKLGEGHKYRVLIKQQIEEKLREMEKLKVEKTPSVSELSSPRTAKK